MTTNHIDQLAEWYESAERITKTNLPNDGDSIIYPMGGGWRVEEATFGWTEGIVNQQEEVRILDRAPKPKPAWHDAVAVIAEVRAFDLPRVFVKDYNGVWNDALTGRGYSPDALSHVTPLIEAKVTDEMVEAARQEAKDRTGVYWERSLVSRMLTAALGLETE